MQDTLKQAFAGKKVFVTGHTGFKGSWLCHWLLDLGAEVMGFALEAPSEPSIFAATRLEELIRHVHGDIRDFDAVAGAMRSFEPEAVFHLAAQPLVRLSYAEPRETFASNVLGTVNVLEAVRATPSVQAAINVTSDKCYENREWVWGYRENDPMGGHDPYSASKGCAELVASAWQRSYFAPEGRVAFGSVRAGNVIGGGDWGADRLVPDCMRAFSRGEDVILRFPGAIRPWQHVLEPVGGYMLLCAKLLEHGQKYAGGWNFGPLDGEVWTVEDVVRRLSELWGDGRGFEVKSEGNPHEAHWLKLDCSKARIDLGWKPRFSVAQSLERTVAWYKLFHSGASATELRELTLSQIRDY